MALTKMPQDFFSKTSEDRAFNTELWIRVATLRDEGDTYSKLLNDRSVPRLWDVRFRTNSLR